MPDPTLMDATQAAQKAKLLTPDDAAWLEGTSYAGMSALSSEDVKTFKDTYKDEKSQADFYNLMQGGTIRTAQYMLDKRNAALVQDSLQNLITYRESLAKAQLPDPAGTWQMAGSVLAQSGRRFAYGLGATAAALGSPLEAAIMGGFENTTLFAMSDAAVEAEDAEAAVMSDITARNEAAGGNRFQLLLGQVLGQMPEMVVGGLGAVSAAKTGIRMTLTKQAAGAAVKELTPAMVKNAMRGATAIQAGQSGAAFVMGNAREAAAEGREVFTKDDIAGGLAVGALVYWTEMLGGLTGEYRLLGNAPRLRASTELGIQMGQEIIQESGESLIGDFVKGKPLNLTEAGWAGLGGMIGGGIMGSATLMSIAKATPGPIQQHIDIAAPLVDKLVKAPAAVSHSEAVGTRMEAIASAPMNARLAPAKVIEALDATSGTVLYQHFTEEGFAKVAEAKGMTPAALMAYWGAKNEAGTITVRDSVLVAHGSKDTPDVQGVIKEHVKSSPDAPSTTDIGEAWDTLRGLAQTANEPVLPDGTKDDSVELEGMLAKEITAADKAAGSKRTAAMAKRESIVTAVMARTAAIEWNKHYAKQGKTDRVTPKQIWEKSQGRIKSGTGAGGLQQDAYHGTGNSQPYDRFAYDKVGAKGGEGAQAYGWGLYFTSLKAVADIYRNKFGKRNASFDQERDAERAIESVFAQFADQFGVDPDDVMAEVGDKRELFNEMWDALEKKDTDAFADLVWGLDLVQGDSDALFAWAKNNLKFPETEKTGKLYTADIPEDGDLLDWDQEVPASVISKIDPAILDGINAELEARNMGAIQDGGYTGKQLYKILSKNSDLLPNSDPDNDQKAASDYLLSIGIPGIKYLGEAKKAGKDITNYVIFDDSKVQIKALEQPGAGDARGTYDWNKRLIAIGKAADASTVHHELMHHWIETTRQWAQDPEAPDVYRQNMAELGAWASDNAASISKAYERVSEKKVKLSVEDIRAAAKDMANLNLNSDRGRAIHEAISYAYEEYLATGKAPTKELQSVFRQIAAWFRDLSRILRRYTTAAGEPLLNENVSRVFDRMLASADQTAQPHMSMEAMTKLGVSPELASIIDAIYGDQLAKATGDVYERIKKKSDAEHARDLAAAKSLAQEEIEQQPVYRAMKAIATQKLDAAAVRLMITGTDLAGMDVSAITQVDGLDPAEVAIASGYENGAGEMLQDLSVAQPLDVAVAAKAEDVLAILNAPTAEERLAAMTGGANSKLAVLSAEIRALKRAARGIKAAAKEGKAEGKAEAQAVAAVDKAELKAKIKQMAEKAKMDRLTHDEAVAQFVNWVRSMGDAGASLDAANRLATKRVTLNQIAEDTVAASKRATKLAAKGDFEAAFWAQWEVEILTEMQKQASARTVASIKDAAADKLADQAEKNATKLGEIKDHDKEVLAAWKASSNRDVSSWNELAAAQVALIPVSELRPGLWGQRARAAEARRGGFAANGNVAGVLKSTEEIAYATAMEGAVQATVSERNALRTSITSMTDTSETGLVALASAGLPTVIKNNVVIKTCQSLSEAEVYLDNAGSNAAMGRSADLALPAMQIRALMGSKTRPDGITMLRGMVANQTSGYINLTVPFINLVETGKLDPTDWTMDDWATVAHQLETLHSIAKNRPSVMAQYDADQNAGAAAVPDDATPPKQDSERSELGNYGNLLMVTMLNPRTLVQKLGDWGRKFFVEDINLIEARVKDYEKVATLMMEKAYTFTAKERRALDEEIETKSGIRTTRMQNLGRLLHWGTDTGRQRVMQDLQVRIKDMKLPDPELKLPADVSAVDREKLVNAARMQRDADKAASFMKEAFKGLTEKEINLINTIWATNEQIYVWDEASALLAGVRLPKKLAHRSFEVTTDSGKIVRLMGGYSTATYDGITRQIDLMKSEGVQEATVNLGFTFERVSTVTGKRLDLTLEAQHREQMSRIRTAAFLPYAKRFNRIMAPNGDFVRKAQEKMGADWVRDVTNHVTFVYNGYERKGIDPVLGYVHRAQTFAVFGLNMLTAARQTLGLIVSAAHKNVGVKASIGSSVDFMMHPSTFARRVYDKSLILSQRLEGVDVDTAAPEKRLGNDRLFRKYERLATWPMRMVQAGVDVITWDAAHKQEYASQIDKGATPEAAAYAARRAADRAVIETQGSGMRSEAARINQTQVGVCVTFAGKWMLNNTNWLMRLYQGGDKAQFVKAVLASVVLSSVAMAASGALLQPEQDDEEQRDLQDYAWKAGIDMVAQPHWMGRFIADFSYALITDAPATGRAQGGIISTGAMIGQGFDQLRRGIQSDDWAKTIGGAVKAGAILPGVPSVQINRSVNAVNDDWESGWEFFLAAMFGRDRVAMVK